MYSLFALLAIFTTVVASCNDNNRCVKYRHNIPRYCRFSWWKTNCPSMCGTCTTGTTTTTSSPTSGGGSVGTLEQQCVDAHNKYRRLHQNTPDAVWDASLGQSAQNWANQLISRGGLKHSSGNYGENLYWSRGFTNAKKDGANGVAAKSWYEEINDYNFATGKSRGGLIGHFTQMVWTTSTRVGCGIATQGRETVVVAQYLKRGNWMGQNLQFVMPLGTSPVITTRTPPLSTSLSPSTTTAGGSGGLLSSLEKQCVDAHNKYRRLHQNTPDAVWDASLGQSAQNWANRLILQGGLQHSRGNYGENLYWGRGFTNAKKDGANGVAAKSWYEEINDYNFATGKSRGGLIGHFTQMVWTTSTRVGCGIATRGRETVVVAQYLKRGNWMGQNLQFVMPLGTSPVITTRTPPLSTSLSPSTTTAGGSGGSLSSLEKQCVDAHNKYRRLHKNTPDAVWDASLGQSAQNWANHLISRGGLRHSSGNYGENLYWSRGFTNAKKDGANDVAAKSWYDEIKDYNFATGKSRGGLIGHFTQMLWTTSTRVGCGIATKGRETVVVAQYLDRGNWRGRNLQFVMPLK